MKADVIIYATGYDISFPFLDLSMVGVLLPPEQLTRQIAERRSRRQKPYLDGPRHTIQVGFCPKLDRMTSLCDAKDKSMMRR